MKLVWLGHACYLVESQGYAIVLDPYADGSVAGLAPLRVVANEVLCSHAHRDHSFVDAVQLVEHEALSPFRVKCVESAHDDAHGALRGTNTIHVLEAEGLRVVHLGDLGHMLTDGQIAAIGRVDAVMIPIGGHYTIDAQTAKKVIGKLLPTVVLPMHYRSERFGFDVISTLDAFTALCDDVISYDGNAFVLTQETPRQTAILQCP